jgi:hypothetical protein
MSVPLELSDLSRNQLWRQIRGFSRSPLGKASTKGKRRSDPSAPAHRHKLAVFPHKVVNGNRGQREGDDGRDTNTTNAGPGQADLVRPLATATVCSVSGLRIGTVLGGEPHGPGSPWIVKVMAATEDTEVESPRSEGLFLHESGLLGVSETSHDLRDLLAGQDVDVRVAEAVALFCYRAKTWLGALAAWIRSCSPEGSARTRPRPAAASATA